MLWHIWRLDLSDLDQDARQRLESQFQRLAGIEQVKWFIMGPHLDDAKIVGLVILFDDAQGLADYRVHPTHTQVAEAITAARVAGVSLDILSESEPRTT